MLRDLRRLKISKVNKEFSQFLKQTGIEFEYEFPIDSKQFDFKIKDSDVVIEFNPSQTHSIHETHFGAIPVNYHCMKSYIAEQNGFRCIHVFAWDSWEKIVDIIKSDIKLIPGEKVITCDKSKFFNSEYLIESGYSYSYTLLPQIHWSKGKKRNRQF